jgi:hypothetical protein
MELRVGQKYRPGAQSSSMAYFVQQSFAQIHVHSVVEYGFAVSNIVLAVV